MGRLTVRGKKSFGSSARRTYAVLGLVALGGIALSGCGLLGDRAEPKPHVTDAAPTPSAVGSRFAVGDCWQQDDYSVAVNWLTWEGGDKVDCRSGHNSITFATPSLAVDFPYPVGADGRLIEPTPAAIAVVVFACRAQEQGLVPQGGPEASMVHLMWYLPTYEQWKAGQRQVRCDLAVRVFDALANDGSEMRSMPATLAGLAAAERLHPLDYEACTQTAAGVAVGPMAAPTTTRIVRCDGPHTWRWVDRTELPAPAGAPFPGDAAMKAAGTAACSDGLSVDQAWWAFWPNAATWAVGDRSIDCWVGNAALTL